MMVAGIGHMNYGLTWEELANISEEQNGEDWEFQNRAGYSDSESPIQSREHSSNLMWR